MTRSRAHALAAAVAMLLVVIGLAFAVGGSDTAAARPDGLILFGDVGAVPPGAISGAAVSAAIDEMRGCAERAQGDAALERCLAALTGDPPPTEAPPGAVDLHPEVQVIR